MFYKSCSLNLCSAGSMTSTPYLYAPLSEELAKADKQAAVARYRNENAVQFQQTNNNL